MSQHQIIKSILQDHYGFKNPQQMITNTEALYGPLRPVHGQAAMNRTIQHIINSNQQFLSLPEFVRKQKKSHLKKQEQNYTKLRKDLSKRLVDLQVATSILHANAMIKYVEFLAKTKLKPVDLDTATAFFFKYFTHPNFQNGFMQYVTDHSVEFYDYLSQLNPGKLPQGMSQSQLSGLKKLSGKKYLSEKGQANPCPICMDEFKEEDVLVQLPCHHVFHQDQIKEWLKTNKKCPLCNK